MDHTRKQENLGLDIGELETPVHRPRTALVCALEENRIHAAVPGGGFVRRRRLRRSTRWGHGASTTLMRSCGADRQVRVIPAPRETRARPGSARTMWASAIRGPTTSRALRDRGRSEPRRLHDPGTANPQLSRCRDRSDRGRLRSQCVLSRICGGPAVRSDSRRSTLDA